MYGTGLYRVISGVSFMVMCVSKDVDWVVWKPYLVQRGIWKVKLYASWFSEWLVVEGAFNAS